LGASPHLQGRVIVIDGSRVCVGIDVAKAFLDVCVLPVNKTARYKNSSAGIAALVKMVKDTTRRSWF
jgi:hypothetical protein